MNQPMHMLFFFCYIITTHLYSFTFGQTCNGKYNLTANYLLFENEWLYEGQFLQSPNNDYILMMQDNGNLVGYELTESGTVSSFWSSGTYNQGQGPYCLVMQSDDNLVIYDSTWTPLWASGTDGDNYGDGVFVVLQVDRNIVIYSDTVDYNVLWASGTNINEFDLTASTNEQVTWLTQLPDEMSMIQTTEKAESDSDDALTNSNSNDLDGWVYILIGFSIAVVLLLFWKCFKYVRLKSVTGDNDQECQGNYNYNYNQQGKKHGKDGEGETYHTDGNTNIPPPYSTKELTNATTVGETA